MNTKKYFNTFYEAKEYAKAHPGLILRRNPDGNGWIVFKNVRDDRNIPDKEVKNKKSAFKKKDEDDNFIDDHELFSKCRALASYYDYGYNTYDGWFDETVMEVYDDASDYARSEDDGWFYQD